MNKMASAQSMISLLALTGQSSMATEPECRNMHTSHNKLIDALSGTIHSNFHSELKMLVDGLKLS